MSGNKVKYIALVNLMSGAIACVSATGEEFGEFKELTMRISTDRQEVLPLEPMQITLRLSNKTGIPVAAHSIIEPGEFLNIYVAGESEDFKEFRTCDWATMSLVFKKPPIVERGFRRSVSGYLYYAHAADPDKEPHGRYLFEEPGIYRLKGVLKDLDGESTIESNILTIKVREAGGDDGAAYEFMKGLRDISDRNVSYGNFLMRDFGRQYHPRWEAFIDKQEKLLSRFPKSRYARYVEYSLGLTYSRRDNEEEAERGVGLLRKASRYKGFFLAEEALRALRRISSKRGAVEKAKEYQAEMADRFPNSPEGRDYLEQAYSEAQKRREMPSDQAVREKQPSLLIWPLSVAGALGVVIVVALVVLLKKKASSSSK